MLLLAQIFRKKKFLVHVRIKEDAETSRWKRIPGNVQVITISKYMRDLLPMESTLLYDSYIFSKQGTGTHVGVIENPLRVGVIGRISSTKGVYELLEVLQWIQSLSPKHYHFYLFGEEGLDIKGSGTLQKILNHPFVTMLGFVKYKQEIYSRIDLVLHVSKTEPLGRIFFEAIDEGKPLVGFDSAGIGEIGHLTGLDELLADATVMDNGKALFEKLEMARNNYTVYAEKVMSSKEKATEIFDIKKYSGTLDKFLDS